MSKDTVSIEDFNNLEAQLHETSKALEAARQELEVTKQNELTALRVAVGYLLQEKQQQRLAHTH